MSQTLTQAELDSVAGLPSREAASVLGVGKSTVNKYREIARDNGGTLPLGGRSASQRAPHQAEGGASISVETRANGELSVETVSEVPQTKDDIDNAMVKRGFNPAEYSFTYRFSEWEAQRAGGEIITMYAARAGAVPRPTVSNAKAAKAMDVAELLETVRSWDFTPGKRKASAFTDRDFVLLFADPQLGKVDINGGSDSTVEYIMESYEVAAALIEEHRPSEVIFADLGDGLENFYNTSSQRETNDLDLTSQVRLLRRVQAEGIRHLAPLCARFTHMSVPSNHGQVRIDFQSQASTASNDWGIEVSHQLEDVFEGVTGLEHVRFVRPTGPHQISIGHTTSSGTVLGATHGDTAGTQQKVGEWWQKQAFGWDNPIRDVQVLLVGHFHNRAVEEVYEGRNIVFGSSADPGSAWFTNRTGRSATRGMTAFFTSGGSIEDLQII